MATVFIPPLLRDLTGGAERVNVSGDTLRRVIDELERAHPGFRERLSDGDRLRNGIAIAVDGEVAQLELLEPVGEASEVHILPAISGGARCRADVA